MIVMYIYLIKSLVITYRNTISEENGNRMEYEK